MFGRVHCCCRRWLGAGATCRGWQVAPGRPACARAASSECRPGEHAYAGATGVVSAPCVGDRATRCEVIVGGEGLGRDDGVVKGGRRSGWVTERAQLAPALTLWHRRVRLTRHSMLQRSCASHVVACQAVQCDTRPTHPRPVTFLPTNPSCVPDQISVVRDARQSGPSATQLKRQYAGESVDTASFPSPAAQPAAQCTCRHQLGVPPAPRDALGSKQTQSLLPASCRWLPAQTAFRSC
jgi:hypothetical protein